MCGSRSDMKVCSRRTQRALCLLLGSLPLHGCGPAALLSMVTPVSDVVMVRDIAYDQHPRQRLDVYTPRTAGVETRPVVVYFYGGSWTGGARGDFLFVAEALVSRGYVTVIPDYRLYPEVRFPAFVEDGAGATAWVLNNIEAYGGDPERVYLMGHSAGAHIAAMLTFDERYLRAAGRRPDDLAGMIGLAGPYDFLPLTSRTLQRIFAPPSQHAMSQPVNFVDGDEPPAFLIHGTVDDTVWPRNTRRLAAKIAAAGGQVSTQFYEGVTHTQLAGAFSRMFRHWAPVLEDVSTFIDTKGVR